MNLIINHSSMQPIYEQICDQIKEKIMHGELQEETMLLSGRSCGMRNQEITELFQIVFED